MRENNAFINLHGSCIRGTIGELFISHLWTEGSVCAKDVPTSLSEEDQAANVKKNLNFLSRLKVAQTAKVANDHDDDIIDNSHQVDRNETDNGGAEKKWEKESAASRMKEQVDGNSQ